MNSRTYAETFKQELLKSSISEDFQEAKKEWEFFDSYSIASDAESKQCICTKHIRNIFLIEHKQTKSMLMIGKDCYKHIDKTQSEEKNKELQKKIDMKKNPEKYCNKCNTKFTQFKKDHNHFCKCQKDIYDFNKIEMYLQNNNFRFGQYKGYPFFKAVNNHSYINWVCNAEHPTYNMIRFKIKIKEYLKLKSKLI
jgi:hypothetical protein